MKIEGYKYITLVWTLFAASSIIVAIRLYVQFRERYRPWREAWVIIAWVLYLAATICDSVANDIGEFNIHVSPPEGSTDDEIDRFHELGSKLAYIQAFLFKPSVYCCKAALLVFFGELQPRHQYPKMWLCICITWVLCAVGCLLQIAMNLFDCWPFYLNWSYTRGECGWRPEFLVSSTVLHAFTDLLVYGIPMVILYNLKNLTRKQRLGAMSMFAVGGISVGFALLTAINYGLPGYFENTDWSQAMIDLSDTVWLGFNFQSSTAMIVVCMPQVRRLYQILYSEKRADRKQSAENTTEASGDAALTEDIQDPEASRLSAQVSATNSHSKSTMTAETVPVTNEGEPKNFDNRVLNDAEKAV